MFKHVLIPTDGSPLSQRAALGAIGLAKALSARVTAISVSAPFHVFSANPKVKDTAEGYKEDCEKRAAAYLDGVGKAAAAAGVAFDGMHVFAERAYAAIIEAADDKGCDAICMASHGRTGLAAVFLGSVTVEVLTHSRIPVVVWR